MPENDLVLRAARKGRTERTPVWLMRQAGRFDPAYRAIRRSAPLPLEELFRTPDLAAEISLLPQRLGVDAIIFFQDILTPLAPMGAEFVFRPGPLLTSPIRTARDVDALRQFDPAEELEFVSQTLRRLKRALNDELPLLGFAGAPLTLAFFLIEGGSPTTGAAHTRSLMSENPGLLHRLLGMLADVTAAYLKLQIEAGVDAVQLFESAANMVSRTEYEQFAHPYQIRVISKLATNVPVILFVKDQPFVDLMADTGADVLSIASCVDLAGARAQVGDRVAIQGNVDHRLLAAGPCEQIDAAVRACIRAGGHTGHILNLGNGLLSETPFDNVCRMIETARTFRVRGTGAPAAAR